MNDNNTKSGPMGPDWADACRTKAEELESIRKQIVHLTSTMSSVNYQMDAWERRLKELTGEGSPSTVRMLPKQKVTFKPRQKLLERVKDIEKESHGRRFRSSRQDECESHSISKLARDVIDHAWEEGGTMDKDSYIQKSDNQPRLQQTEKAASNGMFSMHDSEYCKEESRMSNQPLPEINSKSVKDTSIISDIEDSESGQHDLKEGEKDTGAILQDTQKPLVQREDSTLSNSVSNKPSTSAPKSSGVNKEFKKLFKMLDTEVERRKKERKSKEEDEEKQKAQKLRRAYSHIPTHSSGLYNEFEELFRLLDNQQMNNTRRAEQINIMSELNDVISAVQLGSPLICSECSLGCDMQTNSGGSDDFGSDKNDENKSQSANTDIYSENIEEKLKKCCNNIDDSKINYSSSVCPVFALKSNITALLTKAALTESNGNESSNAVQKVHWAEELQKTYSVSRTENRGKRRYKKKDSRGLPDITDAGYIQSNLNTFPHSSDERSQKNLQLHIKDVLIELPPIPNDLARRRDNAAGMQNELCGWLGQLAEDYPEPKDPMPSPRDGYEHLYMDQRNYRKQSFCLPAVQRFKGKKLTKNQILRKPKVEEIPCEGKSELSDDNVVNPQTDSDDNDVNYMEERKYFREESDENDIEDVCAKLNFVELETPPFQTIKRKEFSALPPIKGIGIRKEKKQTSGRKQHNLELKIDQRKSGDKKRSVSPIKNVLKPLPPMKAKATSQMVNWTQKNVGPIKVPPLDLSSMGSSEKVQGSNLSVNYITDMVQKSPKYDAMCRLQNSPVDNTTDEFYFNTQEEKIPTDNMLRYHFQRKPDDKERESYIFSSTLLGKKIQFASDAERPVKEEFDAFAHKKYRLRDESKDVPMELVKIAMKANRLKGYNNVNHVLQESKRCASLFNSKGDSDQCKRLTSTPSRKTNIGKPNLHKYVQKSYRDACVKEEAELQALRSRLRDCVREEATKKTTRWYQRPEEENMSESARSAIARPCSPVSNRTTA